jgi:hypothetical protein
MKRRKTFPQQCQAIAEATGFEVTLIRDVACKPCAFEDDGFLHIVRRGIRAAFWVSHDDPSVQNENVRDILRRLKIKPTIETLVEEDEQDNDCCPHCGR